MAPVEGEAPVVDENSNVNDLTDLEEKIVGQIEVCSATKRLY